ncbi:MAG: tetraacyldisaccharide 4'-kinase [Marinilabiliaceae bacterium]|nr:tetraacyldisaccharide 4'-kinase [Marinilabiliaceae bacterium]
MVSYLRWILLPFSIIYDIVTRIRNFCFNAGFKKSVSFQIPVISIGNITVGGTGKTPHTEYLSKLLLPTCKTAMISRGYKRLTKGVVVANNESKASDIGDEPFQLHQKFPGLKVIAAEKRVDGINTCLKIFGDTEVILLDDAYQHRHLKPGLSILLIDFNRPIWRDYLLPAGNLREASSGKNRADIIIISKCPVNFTDYQKNRILKKLKSFNPENIFFTGFKYGQPYSFANPSVKTEIDASKQVLIVTGIANPKPLNKYISALTPTVSSLVFSDHHNFSEKDVQLIGQRFYQLDGENKILITTEKDAVRLKELNLLPEQIVKYTYILPIKVQFFFNRGAAFNKQILEYVRKN